MTGRPTTLFLYGTLLDPVVLEAMAGQPGLARRMRVAILDGWRRVPLRGTPYPTLVRARGAATDGAVLRVGPAALARLAAYEGPGYRLVPVLVATFAGPVRAHAWIADRWRADRTREWPRPPPARAAPRR
jgi:gamma-glutamylcyclotransferase (GGCT)/AIG2-like uncharacterized protein YtfP